MNNKTETKKVYNTEELAKYLSISVSTIRKLKRSNRIPYLRIGNKLLFQKESIDKWLNNLEAQEDKNPLFFL